MEPDKQLCGKCKKTKDICKCGRPTKYKKEYCEELIKFFNRDKKILVGVDKNGVPIEEPNELPFFSAFARHIGVSVDTLTEWKNIHAEFSAAYREAKKLQEEHLVTLGLDGSYNSKFAVFTAKNILGWRDKLDTDITSGGDKLSVIGQLVKEMKLDE